VHRLEIDVGAAIIAKSCQIHEKARTDNQVNLFLIVVRSLIPRQSMIVEIVKAATVSI
jgi:hypothetical protein